MKFFGTGIVWDKEREKKLCEFVDGEIETVDKRTADILIELGYKADNDISEDESTKKKVR